ncbi:hypothetical protein DEA8626_00187 [Defluviimonas aquaemixtae]|uniref:DUF58 domain-containing protein n=1 Tax=Albidovulum aquaemixtae TaxID=1542388 RepID=A0A2R8B209_9RHOB|nr:DUF58 domain-containing protein [Defluviimonas aquaemixtae]SPH16676.1 hypothetical protein DEA8626_00187 [Defluviimonas aquaemixtae]
MSEVVPHSARPAGLRRAAEGLASALPPLMADALHLASTVQLGEHGRRLSGMGDEFWQYRPAHAGDEARLIDWRRSARADAQFVREKEWQAAQSIHLWVDDARSMEFSGDRKRQSKADRARLLALALGVLLIRAGERVGLADPIAPPRSGEVQLLRLAHAFTQEAGAADFGAPDARAILAGSRAIFISDFMGDPEEVERALGLAADKGVTGVLLQILDPVEEAFPFDGRTIFESMAGTLTHETRKAGDLRTRYQARLAERKARLADLARKAGWLFSTHHTGDPAQAALLWLYAALRKDH